jgi:hypothetical protein
MTERRLFQVRPLLFSSSAKMTLDVYAQHTEQASGATQGRGDDPGESQCPPSVPRTYGAPAQIVD